MDRSEDPQKDFLRKIEGFVVVSQQIQRQLVDHPLMLGDQLGAGILVSSGAALNQRRFAPTNVRPSDSSNRLHGESLCHLNTPPPHVAAVPGFLTALDTSDKLEPSHLEGSRLQFRR